MSRAEEPELSAEERAARKRRLAEVFGDVLPEQTRDDQDARGGDTESSKDDWLKRQVPPHHGQSGQD
ncbi:hypothetical protein [Nocardioides marmorisolisilvae]|uniref:Uncharacterized protein n=1 Tax=Nocardioides marmorisolisilvae TaxID=1542737 RepID=A0A3N0DRY9_9ACTN|nr:hypothetical protein [Nocardioides marmorisolisilvae]RNL78281.1 hypothetical protein EFL95_04005 [Nocardioides marmorisolisilvae]